MSVILETKQLCKFYGTDHKRLTDRLLYSGGTAAFLCNRHIKCCILPVAAKWNVAYNQDIIRMRRFWICTEKMLKSYLNL